MQPTAGNAANARGENAVVNARAVHDRLPTATLDFWERRHKAASQEFAEAQKTRDAVATHPDPRRRAVAETWCTAAEYRLAACRLELEFAREREAGGS